MLSRTMSDQTSTSTSVLTSAPSIRALTVQPNPSPRGFGPGER